eukprot:5943-Heterococcus_DN1.PRE.2
MALRNANFFRLSTPRLLLVALRPHWTATCCFELSLMYSWYCGVGGTKRNACEWRNGFLWILWLDGITHVLSSTSRLRAQKNLKD